MVPNCQRGVLVPLVEHEGRNSHQIAAPLLILDQCQLDSSLMDHFALALEPSLAGPSVTSTPRHTAIAGKEKKKEKTKKFCQSSGV